VLIENIILGLELQISSFSINLSA
jgi:dynein heavy chain, axonemal